MGLQYGASGNSVNDKYPSIYAILPFMSQRHVVFVLLPGAQLLDLAGPADVFAAASECLARAGAVGGYRVTVAASTDTVETATGVTVHATRLARVRGAIDTLVIPGGVGFAEQTFDPATLRWLARAVSKTRRVASICTGALVLGEIGQLDGRRATTHWSAFDALAARAPRCHIERDALYVRDGPIYTSAGVTAGLDLAVSLVEEDHDREIALAVARGLVMFLHRPGGQSQFSEALRNQAPEHVGIRVAQAHVTEHPQDDHRIPELARRAGLSPRHFVRLFTQQTGEPPARFVQRIRLERARQLLEKSDDGLDQIATRCGFGSTETMRRVFQRAMSVSPAAYRSRFTRV